MVLTNLGQARLDMGDLRGAAAACEEGLPVARAIESSDAIARFLSIGGSIARQRGDLASARFQFTEALALERELGAKDELWRTIEELAYVALATEQFERCVLLLATAASCYELAGSMRTPVEQAAYDHCVTTASAALGTEAFEAIWARGHALPLEEALALAGEAP